MDYSLLPIFCFWHSKVVVLNSWRLNNPFIGVTHQVPYILDSYSTRSSSKLWLWSRNKNNFMSEITTTIEIMLSGQTIRKFETTDLENRQYYVLIWNANLCIISGRWYIYNIKYFTNVLFHFSWMLFEELILNIEAWSQDVRCW